MTMEEFFPKKRRRLDLLKPTLKRNAQNEKRITMLMSMPLEGENLVGIPDYIDAAFSAVGKENSAVMDASVGTELDAMNVRFYQLSEKDSPEKAVDMKLMGALVSGFVVSRRVSKGDTPKNDVTLDFKVTVPYRPAIWGWAGDAAGNTMFAEFEMTQDTFKLAKANEDDGQEEMSFGGSGGEGAVTTVTNGPYEEGEGVPSTEFPTQTEERAEALKGVRATRTKAKKKAAKKKGNKR